MKQTQLINKVDFHKSQLSTFHRMKISMKNNNSEDKSGGTHGPNSIGHQNGNSTNGNTRIRIAVFGQHEVGKSGKNLFFFRYKINSI